MRREERPNVDPYLDQRLTEWARWARAKKWQSSCGSAEKHYLPEAGEVWGSDEDKPMPIDMRDAYSVEIAWRTYLPMIERLILRAHYVTAPRTPGKWLLHVRRTSRVLGIRPTEWGQYVTSAARALEPHITLQIK